LIGAFASIAVNDDFPALDVLPFLTAALRIWLSFCLFLRSAALDADERPPLDFLNPWN